jgi:hypothetical protein
MTDAGLTAAMVSDAPAAARKRVVVAGRLLLAVLLVLGWELGARTLGSVFFAAPLDVAARIVTLARSGQLAADVASTLRVSALGFAIACVAGVLLPFLLRRSPRVSAAVEPYIMASMGFQGPWRRGSFSGSWRRLPNWWCDADGVLHHLHHHHRGHPPVDQPDRHGARCQPAGRRSREIIMYCRSSSQPKWRCAGQCHHCREFWCDGVGPHRESIPTVADTVGVRRHRDCVVLVLAINAVVNVIERRALAWRRSSANGL